MIGQIDGSVWVQMIISGTAAMEKVRSLVNELNVFPVPDGDTGTNMYLTMNAAAAALSQTASSAVGEVSNLTAQALLRGARGNSGVILSLLFRGFAKSIQKKDRIDGLQWAMALTEGVKTAYSAVMKPTEGTILTVARVSGEAAVFFAKNNPDMEAVLTETIAQAEAALSQTVHQNPVLQKAGVIDAGGKGFVVILQGMLAALRGEALTLDVTAAEGDSPVYEQEDIPFLYCTEMLVLRDKNGRDPLRLQAFLETAGDSLVMVEDDDIIKIHVHTNNPGRVLEEALLSGALTDIKIENMREQHTEKLLLSQKKREASPETLAPYGFVAVCAGDGIADVFRDLGADEIITGGQTMNPSTQDILRGIEKVKAQTVFVLPNNKNIVLAAQQCVSLSAKQVVVVPTKSIPQGLTALLAFDAERTTEDNLAQMKLAAKQVVSGSLTYAARDSQFNGSAIAQGDYIALCEGNLLYNGRDLYQVIEKLADTIKESAPSFITIFYGEDVEEEQATQTEAIFARLMPDAEISLLSGGQPVYSYIISAE